MSETLARSYVQSYGDLRFPGNRPWIIKKIPRSGACIPFDGRDETEKIGVEELPDGQRLKILFARFDH